MCAEKTIEAKNNYTGEKKYLFLEFKKNALVIFFALLIGAEK